MRKALRDVRGRHSLAQQLKTMLQLRGPNVESAHSLPLLRREVQRAIGQVGSSPSDHICGPCQ
jgi:hypothetical protein